MTALDKIDRLILCEMDCDSRQSLSSIAKKARLSKESIFYRLQRLEKEGIIRGYPTVIGLAKRGKMHSEVFIRFHNVTIPLKEKMLSRFLKIQEIVDITTCKGSWDMMLGIVVNDMQSLSLIKNKICDFYGTFFAEVIISITMETIFFGRKYLVGKDIHLTKHIDKFSHTKIDDKDEKILTEVSSNSRKSIIKISEGVGLSSKAVSQKIKLLKKSGIIQKHTVDIDTDKLGISTYKMFIRLKSSSERGKLEEYFHAQPNVVSVREVLADWNLEPTIEVSTPEDFYAIQEEIEREFGESIISIQSVMIDKRYKTEFYLQG